MVMPRSPFHVRAQTRRRGPPSEATRVYVKRTAKRLIAQGAEKHHKSFTGNATSIPSTGTVVDITNITQGDTDITRTGDRITLSKIQFNFFVRQNTAGNPATGRILVLQAKTSEAPTLATVLEQGATYSSVSDYAPDYVPSQFKVLYSRSFIMDNVTTSNRTGFLVTKSIHGKRLSKRVKYEEGGTDGMNKLYLMFVSDQGSNTPTITYHAHVFYRDS